MRFFKALALSAVALTVALGGAVAIPAAAQAQSADPAKADTPNALIEGVAQQMLKALDANREQYRKDPKKVYALVDQVLLPHFDTDFAAQQVLAHHWNKATPEQRSRFVKAFYRSLVENYGTALLEFTADKLSVLPFRGDPKGNKATVRTEVKTSNGTRVPVNYTMRKTPQGWKAWDVTIEGISYVLNYRKDFGSAIEKDGMEAFIKRLETQGVTKPAPGKKG